jgi:hypothetical protein
VLPIIVALSWSDFERQLKAAGERQTKSCARVGAFCYSRLSLRLFLPGLIFKTEPQ